MNVYSFFVNWRIYQKILKVKVWSRLRLKKSIYRIYVIHAMYVRSVLRQCEKRRLESYNFSKFTQYSILVSKVLCNSLKRLPIFWTFCTSSHKIIGRKSIVLSPISSVYLGTLRTITKQRKTNSAHRLIYYDVAVKGTRKFTKSNLYIYKAFAQLQAIIGRTSSNQWL